MKAAEGADVALNSEGKYDSTITYGEKVSVDTEEKCAAVGGTWNLGSTFVEPSCSQKTQDVMELTNNNEVRITQNFKNIIIASAQGENVVYKNGKYEPSRSIQEKLGNCIWNVHSDSNCKSLIVASTAYSTNIDKTGQTVNTSKAELEGFCDDDSGATKEECNGTWKYRLKSTQLLALNKTLNGMTMVHISRDSDGVLRVEPTDNFVSKTESNTSTSTLEAKLKSTEEERDARPNITLQQWNDLKQSEKDQREAKEARPNVSIAEYQDLQSKKSACDTDLLIKTNELDNMKKSRDSTEDSLRVAEQQRDARPDVTKKYYSDLLAAKNTCDNTLVAKEAALKAAEKERDSRPDVTVQAWTDLKEKEESERKAKEARPNVTVFEYQTLRDDKNKCDVELKSTTAELTSTKNELNASTSSCDSRPNITKEAYQKLREDKLLCDTNLAVKENALDTAEKQRDSRPNIAAQAWTDPQKKSEEEQRAAKEARRMSPLPNTKTYRAKRVHVTRTWR